MDDEDYLACTVAFAFHRLPPNKCSLCKMQIKQLIHNFEFPENVQMSSGHDMHASSYYNFLM